MCCSTSENGVFGNTCLDQVSAVLMEECFMEVEVIGGVLGAVQSIPLLKLLPMKLVLCWPAAPTLHLSSPPGAVPGAVCPQQGCAHRELKGESRECLLPTARPQALNSWLTGKTSQFTAFSPK